MPRRILNDASIGPDGRIVSWPNGCAIHPNVCDVLIWGDGSMECMHCARERQAARMTPDQRRNEAFHMPRFEEWVQ